MTRVPVINVCDTPRVLTDKLCEITSNWVKHPEKGVKTLRIINMDHRNNHHKKKDYIYINQENIRQDPFISGPKTGKLSEERPKRNEK